MNNTIVVTNFGGVVRRIICSEEQAERHHAAAKGQYASSVSWTSPMQFDPQSMLDTSPDFLARVQGEENKQQQQPYWAKLMDKHAIANDVPLRISIAKIIEDLQGGVLAP